ncbi:MAG: Fe-S-containing protein [Planctomycetota bacterium]|jgi:uncharacterized membrane protein
MRLTATVATVALVFAACSPSAPIHTLVESDGNAVRIPSHEVSDGSVHFFTFLHRGKNVNFLVRPDGRGALHAHLDACYACYRYKLGFIVEDTNLVCIACRLEYRLEDEVWDYIGACAPISIHASLEGDQLVIDQSVIERAARYF